MSIDREEMYQLKGSVDDLKKEILKLNEELKSLKAVLKEINFELLKRS